ncbi:hypothetical protein [Candidatus Arthromitus sp. SFB-rat-Yit]|uniref:hypothetical protein n=1 Tax=Candidatus Arthromitus sp. SFB-rat-Yit TaxID=1041504 RepID=UPI000227A6BC|nr:hypothetical protein [Candidatus Arthromitus sp. SFB-rat-Yit]BAK80633.1 putative C-terminal PDZ domain-containing protein [Candidatus Arthromitus sp. SFB-rat-Yit]
MILYVYLISFILNFINICKNNKVGIYYHLILICKNILLIIFLNLLFKDMIKSIGIYYLDEKVLILICLFSLLNYFLVGRYICISFSGVICYLFLKLIGFDVDTSFIILLIGVLHIFEGVFICLNFESNINKLYLPIYFGGIHIIFLMFFRRSYLNNFKYSKFISGLFVFVYGVIVMILYKFIGNVFSLIMICFLHEVMILLEKRVNKEICKII